MRSHSNYWETDEINRGPRNPRDADGRTIIPSQGVMDELLAKLRRRLDEAKALSRAVRRQQSERRRRP